MESWRSRRRQMVERAHAPLVMTGQGSSRRRIYPDKLGTSNIGRCEETLRLGLGDDPPAPPAAADGGLPDPICVRCSQPCRQVCHRCGSFLHVACSGEGCPGCEVAAVRAIAAPAVPAGRWRGGRLPLEAVVWSFLVGVATGAFCVSACVVFFHWGRM